MKYLFAFAVFLTLTAGAAEAQGRVRVRSDSLAGQRDARLAPRDRVKMLFKDIVGITPEQRKAAEEILKKGTTRKEYDAVRALLTPDQQPQFDQNLTAMEQKAAGGAVVPGVRVIGGH